MKKLFCLIIFFSWGLVACQSDEELLTEVPKTFYTVDNIFNTPAQVDQALVTLYMQLRSIWGSNLLRGNGTDMLDVPSIRKASSFNNYGTINPDSQEFYGVYSEWYIMISRANLAIQAANLPHLAWLSEADKLYVLAQARFFRAFAYLNLAELFGGVPLVTEVITEPRYDFVRASRVETYQYVIDELTAIEGDMPETHPQGGRVVRGAVQHMLSRAYLGKGIQLAAEQKTGEAATAFNQSVAYADKLINGSVYELMQSRFGSRRNEQIVNINVHRSGNQANEIIYTIELTPNVFWDLFQENNVNYQDGNKESIWTLQIDYAAYRAEDRNSHLPYARNFGPVFRDYAKDHFTGTLEDVGGRGIAGVIPNWYMRDTIFTGKWGDDMRNSEIAYRRTFIANVPTSPYYKNPVPWEVLYHGSPSEVTNEINQSLVFPISCKITTDRFTGIPDGENRSNLYRDDYYIRLSETILQRAEAKQRLGDKAGAAADINLLRSRAQCAYLVTAADVDDDFNLILDERARELMYEEFRWNTLLRMGGTIAVDRIRKYAFWPDPRNTLTFNYNLWPIPNRVIDSNKNVPMEQNEGWKNR